MNRALSAALLGLVVACGGGERPAPDNTAVNKRDTSEVALTPGDQPQSGPDLTITQQVRQAVIGDDSLSLTAKNVKIITREAVVTLRGPVESERERVAIASAAKRVRGVTRVDNELEVARAK
jgi:hyperosmotically inducible periplasmic protein